MSGEFMKNIKSKGNASIILCFAITALFGFTAYVIDIGFIYAEKIKLSNAIDSAALSAALELPDSDEKAREVAVEYLLKNNVNENEAAITIGDDHKSIAITAAKSVSHFFAPVIGIKSSIVNAKTKAVIGPARTVNDGIRPLAVEYFNYTYGDIVTLKDGAGDAYHGNYGAVDLGGTGASVFEKNVLYGYKGKLSYGDLLYTETGDMTGTCNDIKNYLSSDISTFDNYERDSIRLWTLPLVDSLDVDGKKPSKVVGFGEFYIEDIEKNGGKMEVTGRFLKFVKNAEIDNSMVDTGVYGAKLSE